MIHPLFPMPSPLFSMPHPFIPHDPPLISHAQSPILHARPFILIVPLVMFEISIAYIYLMKLPKTVEA